MSNGHTGWGLTGVRGGAPAGTPVVALRPASLRIAEIHFATSTAGSSFHYLYESTNTHAIAPGNLQWWARGGKITLPEWSNGGRRNWRACFTRNLPVSFVVKLAASTSRDLNGVLTVTPKLDGSTAILFPMAMPFSYPAGAASHDVVVTLGGVMPDEVGRYILQLEFSVSGASIQFRGPTRTRHLIYGIYGQPLKPAYDSDAVADTGQNTSRTQGTLTGTRRRLDHMMYLIGGGNRRHAAATTDDLIDLYWKLHVGINDTPGAPPYFDGAHDVHMTRDGSDTGTKIPLADQWLAWVRSANQWNDASCIGHVQIAKTMLAAVGLFARRTWVFPHTRKLPDGSTASFADDDLFCLGQYDTSKQQSYTFTHNGRSYVGVAKLMEPGKAWENFEACMLSPNGRFLTGGYATSSNPASFRANKGFRSATELLRWWCNTSRSGFGKRFMAWVYYNSSTNEAHAWDVDGTHYDFDNYVQIRNRGKELPAV